MCLTGHDGNAFAILATCKNSARFNYTSRRWSTREFEMFREIATSGNYDHLLQTVFRFFNVR